MNSSLKSRFFLQALRDVASTSQRTKSLGAASKAAVESLEKRALLSTVSLSPTADAYVRDGSYSTTNFGSASNLQVEQGAGSGSTRVTYLKFDLTSQEIVSGAVLDITGQESSTADSSVNIAAYAAGSNWSQSSITDKNAPSLSGGKLATAAISGASPQLYTLDLSSYIEQEQANSITSVTIALESTGLTTSFADFEKTGPFAPTLVLTVPTVPTPTAVLSPTQDVYVRGGSYSSSNFATAADLQALSTLTSSNTRFTYLQFNIAGQGAMTSAILDLYGEMSSTFGGPSMVISAYPVASNSWTENGIDFNNAPAISSSALLASTTIFGATPRRYTLNLTSYFEQEQAASDTVVSIALVGTANLLGLPTNTTDYADFVSTRGAPSPVALAVVAPPPPIQTQTTFGAAEDAYVDSTNPNTNFGASPVLYAGQVSGGPTYITYLQYDLSSISSSATINNATLSIFGEINGSNPNFQIDALQVPGGTFDQSTITYNNAPVTGVLVNSVIVPNSTPQVYTINLTNYVQADIAAGQTQLTIALVGDAPEPQYAGFASTNFGSNAPGLSVNYSTPQPATQTTFGAAEDAYVDSTNPNTNFGASPVLYAGQVSGGPTYITYLQYDLSSISSSATINNATLSIFGEINGSNPNFQIDALQVPGGTFDQSTITYNNAPVTGVLANSVIVPNSTPEVYTINLTNYVQADIAAGQTQLTIALVGDAPESQYAGFASTNFGSNAPGLSVNYIG